jgi:glycosyltransferase involved in cell wall biosynthesis
MRVELLKKRLEAEGHECVVLNTGPNRRIPSSDYETVLSPVDFVRKVWRFARAGYVIHEHVNGDSWKGFVRTVLSELLVLLAGARCYLTFHAGVEQIYFPRAKAPALVPLYWLIFTVPKGIVCNNTAVKAKIVEYGVNPEKITAIPAFTRQYLEFSPAPLASDIDCFFKRFSHVVFAYIRVREGFNLAAMIEGFALVARSRNDIGLLLVGLTEDIDATLWTDIQNRIGSHDLASRICTYGELDHDEFLTVLTRSTLYLRTPTTDGVASSVLEALALGVPTLAAENGTRPAGVVTFRGQDPVDLADKLQYVIDERDSILANIPALEIRDTLSEEIAVLTETEAVAV